MDVDNLLSLSSDDNLIKSRVRRDFSSLSDDKANSDIGSSTNNNHKVFKDLESKLKSANDLTNKLQTQNKNLLKSIAESPVAQLLLDSQFRIRAASSVFDELLGMPNSILLNTCFIDNLDQSSNVAFCKLINEIRDGRTIASAELTLKTYHQGQRTVTALVNLVEDYTQSPVTMNVVLLDISRQVKLETQLRKARSYLETLANRDPLTNLPNRSRNSAVLRNVLLEARKERKKVALLFLDIDKFKGINDQLGHHIGDLVLCEMANRLRSMAVDVDHISRLGGDEFTVIIENVEDETSAAASANKLLEAIRTPMCLPEQELAITSSIGVSIFPDHAKTPDALTKYADAAMYEAKNGGGNRIVTCSGPTMAKISRRTLLEKGLNHQFNVDEFSLSFQPIVRCDNGTLDSVEVLARWVHPSLGQILPSEFIELAERSDGIIALGNRVLSLIGQAHKTLSESGLAARLCINLSVKQLTNSQFLNHLETHLFGDASHGLSPDNIEFEITESCVIDDLPTVVRVINTLSKLGYRVSIDDFGVGYSSLNRLRDLAVSRIKLDRSFIQNATISVVDLKIVKGITRLAQDLNIEVVVEGVENDAHIDMLKHIGCDYLQGYAISKPVHIDNIRAEYF